jgi:GntR family transcriptional regulator
MDMHSDLSISRSDSRPMYLQITEQIRRRIAVGDWSPGTEMPSIRQLAAALSVSVITVKRAYRDLEEEGVIVTHHGKGSVVAARPDTEVRRVEQELEQVLDQAVELGTLLGFTPEELAARLLAAAGGHGEER